MLREVNAKEDEGFYTQLVSLLSGFKTDEHQYSYRKTDYWGLAIANHLLESEYRLNNNPNFTMSNLTNHVPSLAQGQLPMPIIVAAE